MRYAFGLLLALLLALPASAHRRYVVYSTAQSSAVNTGQTIAVDGLSWPVKAFQTYFFHCYLITSAAAPTTGVQIGWMLPTGNIVANGNVVSWLGTGDPSYAGPSHGHSALNSPPTSGTTYNVHGTYTSINIDGPGQAFLYNPSTSDGTTKHLTEMHAVIAGGPNAGTFQVILKTSAASAVYIEAGSWCEYTYEEVPGP